MNRDSIKDILLSKKIIGSRKTGIIYANSAGRNRDIVRNQFLTDLELFEIRKHYSTLDEFICCYNNDVDEIPKCPYCDSKVSWSKNVINRTCGSKSCIGKSVVDTQTLKYGGVGYKSEKIRKKRDITMLDKYGTVYAMKSKDLKDRYEKTCYEKYNVSSPLKLKQVREKIEETCLKKYNNKCSLHGEVPSIKKVNTWLEKYGVDHPSKSEVVKDKIFNTNKEHHGGKWNLQDEEFIKQNVEYHKSIQKKISEKIRRTNNIKYFCNAPIQNPIIAAKVHRRYLYKNEQFDSSWELCFYIYCEDNNINICRNRKDYFTYYDKYHKEHRYYPDFKTEEGYVEIKGPQLLNKDGSLKPVFNPHLSFEDSVDLAGRKTECMRKVVVKVIDEKEIDKYLNYVEDHYGKDYVQKFRSVGKNGKSKSN